MLSVISRIKRRGRQAGLGQDVAHLVDDLGTRELTRRQVHGHVERRLHRELALQLDRVAARLAEHPAADRDDQPGLLGERDELERLHDAAVGVDPADQRFDAGDPARVQLDHRLVVQDELVVLERALQVGLQLQAPQRGVVHLGFEDLVPALALLLRHVHRDVRVAHQRLGGVLAALSGALGDGDADARADEHFLAFQRERDLEHLHDPVGHVRRLDPFAAVLQEDRELVSAQASGGVGCAQHVLQAGRRPGAGARRPRRARASR